jgi:hypothetical protein
MSGFFEYFKSIGVPYIRKAGGVNEGLVRAAACLLDDSKEDFKWLRNQFFPQLCDDSYVENHAAARGIARYEYESDDFFRNRVSHAYLFFAAGGRKTGVNAFLDALGLDAHVIEYHDYTGEPEIGWAEFVAMVDMESLDQTTANRQFLAALLNELKPARSKLALIFFTLDIQFSIIPILSLAIQDFVDLIHCHGIAARSFEVIGWGCRTLDGSRYLDGGWGTLTITDL